MKTIASLGKELNVSEELIVNLEEYVCLLTKTCYANCARHVLFQTKYKKKRKVTDISLLPPCKSAFIIHIHRSNFVACTWITFDRNIIVKKNIQVSQKEIL